MYISKKYEASLTLKNFQYLDAFCVTLDQLAMLHAVGYSMCDMNNVPILGHMFSCGHK